APRAPTRPYARWPRTMRGFTRWRGRTGHGRMARIDALLRAARAASCEPGEAELLLAHALGRPRSWLYAHGEDEVDAGVAARYAVLLARRVAGEPVAYLTGSRGFWSLELQVSQATLIPRPETALLVELGLAAAA